MSNVSRRDFLKLTRNGLLWLSAALGLGGLFRFLDYDANPAPKTEFDLGLAADYPPGSRTLLADVPAMLLHTEDGFSALSLTCTHLGCTVERNKDEFICPCHGSHFKLDGTLLHGPAAQPLASLRIETTEDGKLILHTV
ncbi:MAG: ubiquinol-cytochrome c reductase iron-sulfur subunit [Anaerolineales bacterium]|jgi:Rieske Fe-S protein